MKQKNGADVINLPSNKIVTIHWMTLYLQSITMCIYHSLGLSKQIPCEVCIAKTYSEK